MQTAPRSRTLNWRSPDRSNCAQRTCGRASPSRHILRRKPELLEEHLGGRGCPEPGQADHVAAESHVLVPPERHPGLDGQPGRHGRRQDGVPIGLRLRLEELPGGHAHHTGRHALLLQNLLGAERQGHLGAGGDQDQAGLASGRLGQDVGAALDAAARLLAGPVENRQVLPRQDEARRAVMRERRPPGLDRLGGVRRPDHPQVGNGAQRHDVLDRLVGRAILPQADAVVGEDEDDRGSASGPPAGSPGACSPRRPGRWPRRAGGRRGAPCRWRSPPWRAPARRSGSSAPPGSPAWNSPPSPT